MRHVQDSHGLPLVSWIARISAGNVWLPGHIGGIHAGALQEGAFDPGVTWVRKQSVEKTCQSTSERVRATAGLLLARYGVGWPADGWSWGWNKSPVSGRIRFGLGSIFPEDVVVALSRNLKHRDAAVRRASAEALKRLGKEAKPAISALLGALNDQDGDVGHAAAETLKAIDPEAAAKAGVE